MPRALITGITGQDGHYLSEHLLKQGYEVYGLIRGQANPKRPMLERTLPDIHIVDGDLLDQASLMNVMQKVQPDEVYNLAAISFVMLSWNQPELTGEITGLGALRVLEAIRLSAGASASRSKSGQGIKFYQASSSEMFGKVRETPQNESTPFHPRSPYGVAKAYAHYITVNYRESYNIFACNGILFNHESPHRGPEFVTRKITLAAARIKLGLQKELVLGNLEPRRDWGFAGDYVRAMHLMMQQPEPDDYVIGTGQTHQIKECAQVAFERVGLNWEQHIRSDAQFMRPAEVDLLIADP
ncbi:MAG: GDP-mannose 4,6-dehydratase, partial [Chloroflexota bacterium]